ncbi:GNAT family N-acetyltransferase [Agromyces seonyuensis]|uniref:GNAT family N-acetyltransferase n=1 Tax=Agromyces seonyuensis TaxID=2662446 RepID=A0A6I4NZS2_9MICO|nr:GNAT family N-acetyltransferase [Agromyces seonyuensis]MWB97269.1 GNAT family N-acetyltransferase [Agromyces seonyuensis]
MSARLVPLAEVADRDAARWAELAERSIDAHPFFEPRFLLTSARHRAEARDLAVVFAEDGDDLVAVLPIGIESRIGGLPIRTVSTNGPFLRRWAGRHHPLVDASSPARALELLLGGMRRLRQPGLLDLSRFPVDGPLAEALAAAAQSTGARVLEREREERVIALPDAAGSTPWARTDAPDFVLPHRGGEAKRRIQRDARGLAAQLDAPLELDDRGADPAGSAAEFLDLEDEGWKGDAARGGEGFRLTGQDGWFTEILAAFAADGRLTVNVLGGGGTDVHLSVNLRSASAEFGFVDTFDRRFHKFRPGVLGRAAAMHKILRTPGTDYFDPCINPSFVESQRLYPGIRTQASLLVAYGGVRSAGLLSALPAARRIRDRLGRPRG